MKFLITFCFSMMMLSCSSIRKTEKPSDDNTFIASILPENTFKALMSPLDIGVYKLEEKRIEGTKDEYTNKAVFIRKLSQKEMNTFISMLGMDASYTWDQYSEKTYAFTPTKEFRLKSNTTQVNIFLDHNKALISFINLDGQNIIPITTKLKTFLEKFQ